MRRYTRDMYDADEQIMDNEDRLQRLEDDEARRTDQYIEEQAFARGD